jgi:hypothetical protein
MKINFRTFVLASAVVASAALTTIPAVAATSTTLKVPFSFTIDGHVLPAGEYSVVRDINHNFVHLRSANSSDEYTWVGSGSADRADRVVMTFNAENHALETVQSGAVITPRIDKKSKTRESMSPIEVSGR